MAKPQQTMGDSEVFSPGFLATATCMHACMEEAQRSMNINGCRASSSYIPLLRSDAGMRS